MNVSSKTLLVAIGMPAAAIAATGVAFAAWTSSGSGTGTATSTADALSVIAPVTPLAADALYPGAALNTFVTISNPNRYPVEVTSIHAGGSALNAGCAINSVRTDGVAGTVSGAVATTVSVTDTVIPAWNGIDAAKPTKTYQLTVRMSNDASNSCKSISSFVIGDFVDATTAPAATLTATLRSAATSNSF